MRRMIFLCLVLLISGRSLATEVTVMSYNVENMFDVFDDPYTGDEGTDVKRRDEIAAIAKVIAHADADIIVFQELENEHLLEGMVKTFLSDGGYDYIACQRTNSTRGINLGVISRYPIKRLASYRFKSLTHPDVADKTWRFARDAMHVTLEVHGESLHIFNVHFKSNSSRPDDKNSMKWRSAEVLGLKSIIRELMAEEPGASVLAMGDFNSNLETRPEQPRPWPATQLMRAPEEDGSMLLMDVFDGIPYDKRVTILGGDRFPPAIFDYIYASPNLAKRLVKNSPVVIFDKDLTSGSDHMPLAATFKVGE